MSAKIRKIGNDTELDRILNKDFVSLGRAGYVEVGDEKICLPIYYEQYEEKIRKFEVREDDVFLIAHPKTGTTWLQELLWLLLNDLDYETAEKMRIYYRTHQLEFSALFDLDITFGAGRDLFAIMEQAKSPRVIKSHLHWSLLPEQIQNGSKNPKIITMFRNPQDTCISLYHYSKSVEGYKGTFEDFCALFLGGRVCFGPFWKQVLSCWQQRTRSNILFLKFKEMKEDLVGVIKKVAEFLGKTLTQEQLDRLAKHLSFESMKKNASINAPPDPEVLATMKRTGLSVEYTEFVRSGKVGAYKSEMSPEMIEKFKAWTEENLLGTGLTIE